MSRTKKSRKPATAPKAKPKLSKEALANVEKRIRKKTGKKPGNRQQEAQPIQDNASANQPKKDPRIGSKKPIALGGSASKIETKTTKAKAKHTAEEKNIAAIRYVESESIDTEDYAQELEAIEADEKLQAILIKQDDDVELSEQEVNYFNTMMERHQQLTEQLGFDEEDSDEAVTSKSSEDDLWDKLDNASDDFSKFE